ncbi:DUF4350 domain-containing protein [Flavobacterium seoulense]|uniref:DUF4350 domain-containing protein n=1 Tax=Flavobacterium seoulense TaxID=1492738 RepID=A0A066WN06_9FLAO|nr:DUF4350 domain-containing protein [Flavobacterium seoulense]KDN55402.1 hypothetical protein FEM21_15290 [Flavobacterium seoulense]
MSKTIKIYIALLVLVFALILYADYNRPKPIDWSPSYSVNDKIPFGLYVFDKEIGGILKNQKIERLTTVTPYEFLNSKYDANPTSNTYTIKGTILNISEFAAIDDASLREIFYFVSHGNTAFLSMKTFPEELLDSLNLNYRTDFNYAKNSDVWLANKNLGTQKYNFVEGMGDYYFSEIDTLTTTVLGYQGNKTNATRVNFIKVPYANGCFYLHTQPAVFSNFHLLKANHHKYAEKVLSYVPKGAIYWYIKPKADAISTSPMRYILGQPALKWAWYFFLIGTLIFIIFNAKRKQRIVPIIKPLSNLTVDFTKTIGNLYYQEGDHNNIVDKKIIYFLEKIRNEYLLDTTKLDEEFINKLHHKSGKNKDDIKHLIQLIIDHRKSYHHSVEYDLIQINKAIEKILN